VKLEKKGRETGGVVARKGGKKELLRPCGTQEKKSHPPTKQKFRKGGKKLLIEFNSQKETENASTHCRKRGKKNGTPGLNSDGNQFKPKTGKARTRGRTQYHSRLRGGEKRTSNLVDFEEKKGGSAFRIQEVRD